MWALLAAGQAKEMDSPLEPTRSATLTFRTLDLQGCQDILDILRQYVHVVRHL